MAALLLTPCRGVTSFSLELNQDTGSARLSIEIERGIGSFDLAWCDEATPSALVLNGSTSTDSRFSLFPSCEILI